MYLRSLCHRETGHFERQKQWLASDRVTRLGEFLVTYWAGVYYGHFFMTEVSSTKFLVCWVNFCLHIWRVFTMGCFLNDIISTKFMV
jgi:hypothetical protein